LPQRKFAAVGFDLLENLYLAHIYDMSDTLIAEQSAFEAIDSLNQVDLGASFVKMMISLIAIVVLLFLTYYLLRKIIQKKLQSGSPDSSIFILERRVLSPKTMLYLVEVEGKKVLLAESQLEIKKIETIAEEIHRSS
jgi:flagellar biogenesis protein FliO